MEPTVVYEDEGIYTDGSRYEMIATEVPQSEAYPEGVKYRFQYMTNTGTTILRFDNFPEHPAVDRHHYHTPDGVFDDIEYTGLKDHIQRFYLAMDAKRERDSR